MAQLISGRYANALFDLALEKNNIDEMNDQISLVYSTVCNDKNLLKVMQSPQLDGDAKFGIIKNTFQKYVSPDVLGFFALIFRKNREDLLTEILEVFLAKVKEHKGIATAEISSAKPLKQEKLEEIAEKLSKKFNKQIEIKTIVDPSLIGGLKIRICGHQIDGTIKRQVDEIKKNLLDIRLA